MKKFFLLSLMCIFSASIFAQINICTVDTEMWADSSAGVYPRPFNELDGTGGIEDTICLNTEYQTILTVVVSESIELNGINVPVDSLQLLEVVGLPEGITYECSTPNCVYKPEDIAGCITVYGTATNADQIGSNEISVSAILYSLFDVPINFPDPIIAPGTYSLEVKAEGSENCTEYVNTTEVNTNISAIKLYPNPASEQIIVEANLEESDNYQLVIRNLFGAVVMSRSLDLQKGMNNVEMNIEQLKNGIYTYNLQNENGLVSRKFVVQH